MNNLAKISRHYLWMAGALLLLSIGTHGQFMTVNLDISAKTGMSEQMPLVFSLLPDPITGHQTWTGTAMFAITAMENLQVMVRVQASDSLVNGTGQAMPLEVKLAYLNDGSTTEQNAVAVAGSTAVFPLSSSGLLIENMRNNPTELRAFVLLKATTGLPQNTISAYQGIIDIHIELN